MNGIWNDFYFYLDRYTTMNERGVVVVRNGASCDMEWFYCITQAHNATLSFPDRVKYFLDPYHQIK